MSNTVTQTGGAWDRTAWPTYFIAADLNALETAFPCHKYLLTAVNELRVMDDERLVALIEKGAHMLIDSGVYWLSTQHAKKHSVTMDVALSMAPDKIDGFDELFERYVAIVGKLGAKAWGSIEIDQGGRDNKIKTRARLEKMGIRPIPVYHPINDGWEYFDYLAQRYDRICFGNVVNADIATRKRLVATAWERRRAYPHLWIHLLGLTPSELTAAFPSNSCDSSTWIAGVRWGVHSSTIANVRTPLEDGFLYDRASDIHSETGHRKAWRLGGYDAHITRLTMANIAADQQRELGADIGLFNQERKS